MLKKFVATVTEVELNATGLAVTRYVTLGNCLANGVARQAARHSETAPLEVLACFAYTVLMIR